MPATRPAASPVQLYADFRRDNPGTAIPVDYVTERGIYLDRWQDRQRVARMLGTLPPHRIAELDAIGFLWSEDDTPLPAVSRVDSKRRRMLTEIAAYREEHGNALAPANYVTHDEEQVGRWLYRAVKKWRADALPDDEHGPLTVLGVSPIHARGPRTSAQCTGSAVRHPARRPQNANLTVNPPGRRTSPAARQDHGFTPDTSAWPPRPSWVEPM